MPEKLPSATDQHAAAVAAAACAATVRSTVRLHGGQSGDAVWKVTLADGASVVVRQFREAPPSRRDWLQALAEAGRVRIAVPGSDAPAGWQVEPFLAGTALGELPPDEQQRALPGVVDAIRRSLEVVPPTTGPSPTVRDRLAFCDRLLRTGDTLDPALPTVRSLLADLRDEVWPLRPVWKDLWSAHVLIDAAREPSIGLIDPGVPTVDHIAVDLARLLGSLPWFDRGELTLGLSDREQHLADVLESSGLVLSRLRWQQRPDSLLKQDRLAQINARLGR